MRWTSLQIRLHWLVALFVAIQWWSGDTMEAAVDALQRQQNLTAMQFLGSSVHSYTGFAILFMVLLRLWLRFRRSTAVDPKPRSDHGSTRLTSGSRIIGIIAALTHFCLYAVLIALALSGILSYYNILSGAADLHERGGSVLLALVILHVVAVVYHNYIIKDGVLARMWPDSWRQF